MSDIPYVKYTCSPNEEWYSLHVSYVLIYWESYTLHEVYMLTR